MTETSSFLRKGGLGACNFSGAAIHVVEMYARPPACHRCYPFLTLRVLTKTSNLRAYLTFSAVLPYSFMDANQQDV